ncbi:MAG: MFS transporter [Gemmatimonadota bacterium]|nr:MFS transporter [Gemmatimonadota bacterium]
MSSPRPGAAARAPSGPGAMIHAFRHRDYRIFWSGALVSNVGSWMQQVAHGWLVLELTDSAFMLGLVGFAATFPMLVLLLVGGVYADRFDRRRLLLWANGALMASATALAALTWTGIVEVWHIFVLALVSGIAIALAAPAFQAFVHDLVGTENLQNAIALNSAQFNLSRVVGPSLAGMALGAIGLAGCFGVNALSYVAAIGALLAIRIRSGPAPDPAPVLESMKEGVGYVRGHPRILALLSLVALVSVLAMPYATLLPIIARDALGLDASGLGYLYAVGGTGAVIGALSLTARHLFRRRGLYLLGLAALTGAATAALGLARTPVAAGAALVVISFAATSAVALSNTLLQEIVDDAMRGRVMGMFGLAFMGTFPIGNLVAGAVAGAVSASTTMLLTGTALLAVSLWIAATRPRLRSVR